MQVKFKIFLSKDDLDKWPHFLSTISTLYRVYSTKKGHGCDFSEKGQKREKYLKIWAKMYKI